MPPATWVELLEQERVEEVLQRLDAVIAAEPRVVGFRRRPDPDQIAAKHWQRVLAALFSAVSGSADSPERLARVLESPESREFAERLGFWLDAMVTSIVGELRLLTSGGIESVVLPLVARLHARGEVEAARRWVEWALEGAPSPALRCAEVALAFRIDDDAAVVRLTDRLASGDDWTLVMQTYRARALQRMGRAPAARQVLDDVVKLAARLDDEGDLLVSARYLRSRAAILNGRVAQAMDDLHAIEAVESDFLDVKDVLANLTVAQPGRRVHIPKELRFAVFERCGGRCTDCGAAFDIQYDHIIPLARGGSSNIENLQLLCGDCNRRKSATLG